MSWNSKLGELRGSVEAQAEKRNPEDGVGPMRLKIR